MKNPWMSLWLSAANRAAATARGHGLAEARRQQRAYVNAAEKALMSETPPEKRAVRKRHTPGG
jgi:hypothetical protein